MLISRRPKLPRNNIDTSTTDLARYWRKRLNKSTKEIDAAVAKVGNSAASVIKELHSKRA